MRRSMRIPLLAARLAAVGVALVLVAGALIAGLWFGLPLARRDDEQHLPDSSEPPTTPSIEAP